MIDKHPPCGRVCIARDEGVVLTAMTKYPCCAIRYGQREPRWFLVQCWICGRLLGAREQTYGLRQHRECLDQLRPLCPGCRTVLDRELLDAGFRACPDCTAEISRGEPT